MVRKATVGWRLCVDFTNLNATYPKDSYPLPNIDSLINRSSGFELFNFMDAYSTYDQIYLRGKDEEATNFTNKFGTFCFKVMSFGLKNVGATFQRLMDRVFKNKIG